MEYINSKDIKEAYIKELISQGNVQKAVNLSNKDYTNPIFDRLVIHSETEPNIKSINEGITDISMDILSLNKEISTAGNRYNDLMNEISFRLDSIESLLLAEENRIKDMNIICGNYNEFVSVKTLNYKYFKGSFGYDNNYIFFAYPSSISVDSNITILSIDGNGYEGNKYVYYNNAFLQESLDTSNRNYLIDDHISTYYEYSRLTCNTTIDKYPKEVNFDAEEAQCTILCFNPNKKFNTIKISSDYDDIIIKDILYSTDNGNTFTSCLNTPIKIDNLTAMYNDNNYIYGSGIICFPSTNYIKIVFASSDISSSDKIAFTYLDTDTTDPIEKIIILDEVKRHVIRINDLSVITGNYSNGTKLQTDELISNPVESIAIFVNEYIPSYFPSNQEYIQYILTINGIDYDIVPINSNKEGIKVIRSSTLMSLDDYAKHINESIKSAKLTIVINTPDQYTTPYISNVKICYGKAAIK